MSVRHPGNQFIISNFSLNFQWPPSGDSVIGTFQNVTSIFLFHQYRYFNLSSDGAIITGMMSEISEFSNILVGNFRDVWMINRFSSTINSVTLKILVLCERTRQNGAIVFISAQQNLVIIYYHPTQKKTRVSLYHAIVGFCRSRWWSDSRVFLFRVKTL